MHKFLCFHFSYYLLTEQDGKISHYTIFNLILLWLNSLASWKVQLVGPKFKQGSVQSWLKSVEILPMA